MDLFSKKQLQNIEAVIANNGELLVQIYYPHSGGDSRYEYRLNSFQQFTDLLSRQLWPEIEILVFLEQQYPLRGEASNDLYKKAIQLISDGEGYAVVDLDIITIQNLWTMSGEVQAIKSYEQIYLSATVRLWVLARTLDALLLTG